MQPTMTSFRTAKLHLHRENIGGHQFSSTHPGTLDCLGLPKHRLSCDINVCKASLALASTQLFKSERVFQNMLIGTAKLTPQPLLASDKTTPAFPVSVQSWALLKARVLYSFACCRMDNYSCFKEK